MLLAALAFAIPDSGNAELQGAFNAALMKLKLSNQLNVLYAKYFGISTAVDASVFQNMFGGIVAKQSDFFIFPTAFDAYSDCAPQVHYFPDPAQITTDGALSNVITARKLYVLRTLDAPGFFETKDAARVYGGRKDYYGYEEELLQLVADQISLFYLNEANAIKVVYDEKQHKATQGWKDQLDFATLQTSTNQYKITTSTTLTDFSNQITQRKYHVAAGGLLSNEMMEIGNFGCGEMLAEIGVMVNFQALEGVYYLSEQTSSGFSAFKQAVSAAKSAQDIFNAVSASLQSGANLPICTKHSTLAHYFTQSQLSFCDQKCTFKNYFTNSWNDAMDSGTGAWDAFVNNKCALFAADTTTMLALYKQLKEGIDKGVFDSALLKYQSEIKYKYLFAFDKQKTDYQAFDANMDDPYVKNTYSVSVAFQLDAADHSQGNYQLVRMFNFMLDKWATTIATPYLTEYGAALKENFVRDKNVEEFVQIDNSNWLVSSAFAYFNEEQRRNINKVYNKINSKHSVDAILTLAIENLKNNSLTDFYNLMSFVNSTKYVKFPISDRAVLLYSIFADNLASSRVYASVTGTQCPNTSQPCNEILIGKNELYSSIHKNVAIMPQSINVNFANDDNIYKPFFNAEYIPGSFVITGLKNFNKGAFRYKKESSAVLTEQEIVQRTIECATNMSQNKSFPDFIFLTNHFVSLINGVVNDQTITAISYIQNSTFYNKDILEELTSKYAALFANQFVIKDEVKATLLDAATPQKTISSACKNSTAEQCYFYSDYATNIQYDPFKNAAKNLATCSSATDFYTIGNMFPLAQDAISKMILTSSFLNENYTCNLAQTQLNNVPSQFHAFFDSSYSKYSEVLLCIQFSELPLAFTSHSEAYPSFSPEVKYGAYQAVMSKRIIKIGAYNQIKGFHDTQNNGLEDRFLKAATKLFKDELGASIIIILVNDLMNQSSRLSLLQQSSKDAPDIDLIYSAQYAEQNIVFQQNQLRYTFQTYGRNYLTANISIITHISSKYAALVQNLALEEYIQDDARLKNVTFCVVAGSQAQEFFNNFRSKAAVNNFTAKPTTNTQTALSSLAAQSCDMVMAHDTDATPWLLGRSDFVFKSFESGQMILSAVFRRDTESSEQAFQIAFRDGAVSNMLWASLVLLLASTIVFVVLCLGFRTYV